MKALGKIAIVIMGPPGSGKGTQANLWANRFGLVHFDTGSYLDKILNNPTLLKKNAEMRKERHYWNTGMLNTPSWVLDIVKNKVKKINHAGLSVVFSGSPRTFYEGFGDKKNEGLMKFLEKEYGRKNIFIFKINVLASSSIKRNSARMLCSICGTQILGNLMKTKLTFCPFCGGKLKTRTLDKPKIIKERLKEYEERTQPMIKELKKRKYRITEINGAPLPFKIHEKIIEFL